MKKKQSLLRSYSKDTENDKRNRKDNQNYDDDDDDKAKQIESSNKMLQQQSTKSHLDQQHHHIPSSVLSKPNNRNLFTFSITNSLTITLDSMFPNGNIGYACAFTNHSRTHNTYQNSTSYPLTINFEVKGNPDYKDDISARYWLYFRMKGYRKGNIITFLLKDANHLRKFYNCERGARPIMVYKVGGETTSETRAHQNNSNHNGRNAVQTQSQQQWKPVQSELQIQYADQNRINGYFEFFIKEDIVRDSLPVNANDIETDTMTSLNSLSILNNHRNSKNLVEEIYFAINYPYSEEDLEKYLQKKRQQYVSGIPSEMMKRVSDNLQPSQQLDQMKFTFSCMSNIKVNEEIRQQAKQHSEVEESKPKSEFEEPNLESNDTVKQSHQEFPYFNQETLIHSVERRKVSLITITSSQNIQSFTDRQPRIHESIFPHIKQRPFKYFYIYIISLVFRLKKAPVILISGRVHPSEVSASFFIQGIIDFLMLKDNPFSKTLRQMFIFIIVPIINVDGVSNGNYRHDNSLKNMNRFYGKSNFQQTQVFMHHVYRPQIKALEYVIDYYKGIDLRKRDLCMKQTKKEGGSEQMIEQDGFDEIGEKRGHKQLQFYFDVHGHQSSKSSFLFGNFTQNVEHMIENKALCKLVERNFVKNWFKSSECDFSKKNMTVKQKYDDNSKMHSGRAFTGMQFEDPQSATNQTKCVFHSYTLQISPFCPTFKRNPTRNSNKSIITPHSNPRQFIFGSPSQCVYLQQSQITQLPQYCKALSQAILLSICQLVGLSNQSQQKELYEMRCLCFRQSTQQLNKLKNTTANIRKYDKMLLDLKALYKVFQTNEAVYFEQCYYNDFLSDVSWRNQLKAKYVNEISKQLFLSKDSKLQKILFTKKQFQHKQTKVRSHPNQNAKTSISQQQRNSPCLSRKSNNPKISSQSLSSSQQCSSQQFLQQCQNKLIIINKKPYANGSKNQGSEQQQHPECYCNHNQDLDDEDCVEEQDNEKKQTHQNNNISKGSSGNKGKLQKRKYWNPSLSPSAKEKLRQLYYYQQQQRANLLRSSFVLQNSGQFKDYKNKISQQYRLDYLNNCNANLKLNPNHSHNSQNVFSSNNKTTILRNGQLVQVQKSKTSLGAGQASPQKGRLTPQQQHQYQGQFVQGKQNSFLNKHENNSNIDQYQPKHLLPALSIQQFKSLQKSATPSPSLLAHSLNQSLLSSSLCSHQHQTHRQYNNYAPLSLPHQRNNRIKTTTMSVVESTSSASSASSTSLGSLCSASFKHNPSQSTNKQACQPQKLNLKKPQSHPHPPSKQLQIVIQEKVSLQSPLKPHNNEKKNSIEKQIFKRTPVTTPTTTAIFTSVNKPLIQQQKQPIIFGSKNNHKNVSKYRCSGRVNDTGDGNSKKVKLSSQSPIASRSTTTLSNSNKDNQNNPNNINKQIFYKARKSTKQNHISSIGGHSGGHGDRHDEGSQSSSLSHKQMNKLTLNTIEATDNANETPSQLLPQQLLYQLPKLNVNRSKNIFIRKDIQERILNNNRNSSGGSNENTNKGNLIKSNKNKTKEKELSCSHNNVSAAIPIVHKGLSMIPTLEGGFSPCPPSIPNPKASPVSASYSSSLIRVTAGGTGNHSTNSKSNNKRKQKIQSFDQQQKGQTITERYSIQGVTKMSQQRQNRYHYLQQPSSSLNYHQKELRHKHYTLQLQESQHQRFPSSHVFGPVQNESNSNNRKSQLCNRVFVRNGLEDYKDNKIHNNFRNRMHTQVVQSDKNSQKYDCLKAATKDIMQRNKKIKMQTQTKKRYNQINTEIYEQKK